jgi:hypothetical protein
MNGTVKVEIWVVWNVDGFDFWLGCWSRAIVSLRPARTLQVCAWSKEYYLPHHFYAIEPARLSIIRIYHCKMAANLCRHSSVYSCVILLWARYFGQTYPYSEASRWKPRKPWGGLKMQCRMSNFQPSQPSGSKEANHTCPSVLRLTAFLRPPEYAVTWPHPFHCNFNPPQSFFPYHRPRSMATRKARTT